MLQETIARDDSKGAAIEETRQGETSGRQYNMVDLFAGCGGLSLGFHAAG